MIETPVIGATPTGDRNASGAGGPPRFFALFVAPSGTVLAGTCGRGISRSLDGGETWQPVDETFGGADVNGLAATPDGALLAAAGTAGVMRSTDDGVSWERLGPDGTTAYAVTAEPQLMVGTSEGVSSCAGGALPWTAIAGGPGSAVYRMLPMADGRVLVATDGDGVWILDRDRNWATTGLTDASVFALVDLEGGRVLAGTRGDGVHRSDDAGATWTRLDGGLPDPAVHVLTSADGCVLAGTGRGVVRSDDGGASWTPVGVELAHHRIFSIAATADGVVVVGSYDGVWTCELATERWRPVDTGLTVGEAYAVAADADGFALVGAKGGTFESSDAGATWASTAGLTGVNAYSFCFASTGGEFAGTDDGLRARPSAPRDGWHRDGLDGQRVFCLLEPAPGSLLAGTLGGGVLRREHRDGQWKRADTGLPHPMVFDLLRSTTTGDLFAAAGNVVDGTKTGGIYRSVDGGHSWASTGHDPITVYAIVETSDGTMVAGAQRSCVLRSTDNGATWTATRPAGLDDSKMYCLAIDDADRLYLGSGAQLLRSDDAALSWQVVGDGLDGVTVYDLCAHPSGALLAATSSGVYRSHDHGQSWSPSPWPD